MLQSDIKNVTLVAAADPVQIFAPARNRTQITFVPDSIGYYVSPTGGSACDGVLVSPSSGTVTLATTDYGSLVIGGWYASSAGAANVMVIQTLSAG